MITQRSVFIPSERNQQINPPSLSRLPLINILPFLGKHLHLELYKLSKKQGNIFQLQIGGKNLVVISGLETIKEALVNQQDVFSVRADFDAFKDYPQHELMELKSGEAWKKHRKAFAQNMRTFVSGKSDLLESWLKEEADNLVNAFTDSNGVVFEPDLPIFVANANFLHRIAFGNKDGTANFIELNDFLQKLPNGLLNTVKLEIMPPALKPIFRWYRREKLEDFYNGIGKLIHYVTDTVDEHKQFFKPGNLNCFADALLQASSELTESERNDLKLGERDVVNGTLVQFFGAGSELPSLIIRWALLYAIAYPEIQAEVQQELDRVVGKERQVCSSDRGKLPLVEAYINEVFRHSSATVMPPITNGTAKDTTLNGYLIPKNTTLLVNYYSLNQDERYWDKPEQFNPHRFIDANGKFRKDLLDKFYPFGMGARRCVGEHLGRIQIFMLLANLIHKCQFAKVPGEKITLEPLPGAFPRPEDYRVIVKTR